MNFQELLHYEILENSMQNCLWFVGILGLGLLLKRGFSILIGKFLYRFVRHDNISVKECLVILSKPIEFFILLIITYLAFDRLHFPDSWGMISVENFGLRLLISKAFQCVVIGSIAWILIRLVKFLGIVFLKKATITETKLDDQFIPFFKDLAIVAIYAFAGFAMLGRVFNVDVPALITGLGIGGLAIALAARETLENLFASFTIFLDLPFVVGDNILLDKEKVSGDVEKIGFRSTRIRTGDGSLLTVPNRLLTSQALENLTQRNFRKVKYTLKLKIDTPPATLQKITAEIQTLVEKHELIHNPDTGIARFDNIGDYSLDILIAYSLATNDGGVMNKIKEEINLEILKIIQNNKASLAMPNFQIITSFPS